MRSKLIIAGFVSILALIPSSAAAMTPTPSASPSPNPSSGVAASASPTPSAISAQAQPKKPPFWDIIGRVRYAIGQWFAGLVTAALKPVFGFLGRTVFSTPDVARNGRVVELWRFSLGIADALLLLFVLAGVGIVMAGNNLAAQMTAKEMLPRLVVAAGAANVSLILLHEMTQFSTAVSRAMLGAGLDSATISGRMSTMMGVAAMSNPFLALFALAVVVLAILVLIAYVARVAALVILAIGGPLMLATHALPQSEGLARTWWRATFALLCVPVLQSMLLAATFRVFLADQGLLGLPLGNGLIDLLVLGCLLYLLYKVTFLAIRYSFSASGSGGLKRQAMNLVRVAVSA